MHIWQRVLYILASIYVRLDDGIFHMQEAGRGVVDWKLSTRTTALMSWPDEQLTADKPCFQKESNKRCCYLDLCARKRERSPTLNLGRTVAWGTCLATPTSQALGAIAGRSPRWAKSDTHRSVCLCARMIRGAEQDASTALNRIDFRHETRRRSGCLPQLTAYGTWTCFHPIYRLWMAITRNRPGYVHSHACTEPEDVAI